MQAKRYQAFISHNSKDKPQVRRIVNELFSYFSIWFDKADMLYGEDWIKQITQGLKDSNVCVIFVGKNGFGPSQEKEIQLAKDLKIRICCAFLPGAVPEKVYEQLQISNTTMYSNYMEGESRIAFESLAAGILGKPIGWEFLIGVKLQKRAEEWSSKKTRTLLYKGDELQQAQSWKKKHLDEIGNLELVFLKASLDAQKVRIVGWIIATTSLLCIIGSLATFGMTRQPAVNAANTQSALQQAAAQNANATAQAEQERADEQNKIARAGQLADQAESIRGQSPIVSFLLSIEAFNLFDNFQTRSTLMNNKSAYPRILRFISNPNVSKSNKSYISAIAVSEDSKIIAFAIDDTIVLQDTESGQQLRTLALPPRNANGDRNYVGSLTFSPDSKILVSGGSSEGKIILWDVDSGLISRELNGGSNLAFSSDGQMLAASGGDAINIWKISTDEKLCNIKTYSDSNLSFIPQTNKFVTSVYASIPLDSQFESNVENNILIWDTSTCKSSIFTFDQQIGRIFRTTVSSDGGIFALETITHDVVLWNISTNQPIITLTGQDYPDKNLVALSPDGKTLAVGYKDGNISLWDITSGKLISELNRSAGGFGALLFVPDGNALISISYNEEYAVLWGLNQKQDINVLTGHVSNVNSVAFSPDGSILASGSNGTSIILWDISTGKQICTLDEHTKEIIDVAFESDRILISTDILHEETLTWNPYTCQQIPNDNGRKFPYDPNYHGFSPDGQIYANEIDQYTIILEDTGTSQPIGEPLIYNASSIFGIAFSPNGKILAAGCDDGTIVLWDVATSKMLARFTSHTGTVYSLDFSPDGKVLASGSGDSTVRLWEVDPQTWLQEVCQTAGRNLTKDEWNRYFPGEEYRITCPMWLAGE
jgi:WD40 repeat protein